MLALFGQNVDNIYVSNTKSYLYKKFLKIVDTGISVILDWGFWTQGERQFAKEFYTLKGIVSEFHYIDISHREWQNRLYKRNKDVF